MDSSCITSEIDSDCEEEETEERKHCGVWDYRGDAIVMEGFGFRDRQGDYYSDGRGSTKDHRVSTELAIQLPVPFKQREDVSYKRRRHEKCNLSVIVHF